MLYDHATIVSSDVELYGEATKYAARFWFDALRHDASLNAALRTRLRRIYVADWSAKVESLAEGRVALAS